MVANSPPLDQTTAPRLIVAPGVGILEPHQMVTEAMDAER